MREKVRFALKRVLVCGLAALLAGLPSVRAEAEDQTELMVLAAASLTDALNELASVYQAKNSRIRLVISYAGSGALQTQIEQGAPADIFVSAAAKNMDALVDKGLMLPKSKRNLLTNSIVLVTPGKSGLKLASFQDCASDQVKMIALGDPASVPAGQYAMEVFESLGIAEAVKAKANLGTDVRQVLTWVEEGTVDCGVVYATDAAGSKKVNVVASAPPDSHKPIIYPAALASAGKHQAEAEAFLEFLASDQAGAIFKKYGFSRG